MDLPWPIKPKEQRILGEVKNEKAISVAIDIAVGLSNEFACSNTLAGNPAFEIAPDDSLAWYRRRSGPYGYGHRGAAAIYSG